MGAWMGWIILGAAALALVAFTRKGYVRAEKARQLMGRGAVVVDVRTDREFAAGHVEGARHVPLDKVKTMLPEVAPDTDTPILLHCHSGGRSALAVGTARRAGYRNAGWGQFARNR